MAFFLKLLCNLNFPVRYVAYIVLFVSFFLLLRILPIHHHVKYRDIVPGLQMFNYNDSHPPHNKPPKYILAWEGDYLIFDDYGQSIFPSLQCRVNNCIFTEDKYLLKHDYTNFDALIFTDSALTSKKDRPQKRSPSQIYIFHTIESSYNKPACELFNDDFFNWTLTYRLDSDVPWNYFIVRNATRHTVAPGFHVKWKSIPKEKVKPVSRGIRDILRKKTKAAAWLVSHCGADSLRDIYLNRLQEHLFHYALKIDVYGDCSKNKCTDDDCEEMFTRDYYFYMAFENSFSEDYVTEKVLHGYNNYVVPIVYGGANYTRFLPPGSYLNARNLHPYNLAHIIHEAIKDPAKYEKFFWWTHLYTIDSVDTKLPDTHPLCKLCEALNSKARRPRRYRKFRLWWNGLNGMKWCLPHEYWNETSLVNLNGGHVFNMY